MTEGQVTLALSIGGSLLGVLIGFFLNFWNSNRIENKRRRQEALETHFNQEMAGRLTHIAHRSSLVTHTERNKELGFSLPNEHFYRFKIDEEFPLIGEGYEAFKIHFPKIAGRWEELYKHALKLYEDNQNNRLDSKELDAVSKELQELSRTATSKLEDIRRYQIGTVFKHNKKCPICRKF